MNQSARSFCSVIWGDIVALSEHFGYCESEDLGHHRQREIVRSASCETLISDTELECDSGICGQGLTRRRTLGDNPVPVLRTCRDVRTFVDDTRPAQ